MSITDQNSVLLLGAGVSAPFGVPLGGDLVDMLADWIGRDCKEAVTENNWGHRELETHKTINWGGRASHWHQHPIYGTIVRSKFEDDWSLSQQGAEEAQEQLEALHRLLANQTAETIDAFIAENPGVAETTKMAIASTLLKSLYLPPEKDSHELKLRPLASRQTEKRRNAQSERNWVHRLVNIIRHGIDNQSVTENRKIPIITFNYDTVLEYVLEKQFRNREAPLEHYSKYIEIIHVHGQFEYLKETCSDPAKTAEAWAKGINVVNERTLCPAVETSRARAREIILESQKIYAIGFSFAGPNCRLLGLDQGNAHSPRQLIYCNYDGNQGVAESATRYVSARSIIGRPGSWDRPLSVTDFIKAGFLGEPPG